MPITTELHRELRFFIWKMMMEIKQITDPADLRIIREIADYSALGVGMRVSRGQIIA